jgi:UDP-N-acetylglucosamine transferase subunit ALG13
MTTLLVSTIGGPLTELVQLAPRLEGIDTSNRVWVTHDSPQSRSLLAGEDVVFVPYIKERDLAGVMRAFIPARRLMRDRSIGAVVSTGAAIAVGYLGAARSLRREAMFIESVAFVSGLSKTARIVQRIPGVEVFSQSPLLERRGFPCRGSVLDGFDSFRTPQVRPVRRMVVTVGTTEEFGFRRLFERLAKIVPAGVEVLWQTGCNDVSDLGLVTRPWVPAAELVAAMADADVVIAHAGGGSALDALAAGRRPVLVPRMAHLDEVGNDHQLQLAGLLDERGLAFARQVDELHWEDVVEAAQWSVQPSSSVPAIDLTGAA